MRKPGVWAMLRTFLSWWRLWLAGVLDEHATDPPPAFIAVAVRQQGWSAARVANFYEGLLADRNRDLKTYADRARDVEQRLREARALGYWEAVQHIEVAARCAIEADPPGRVPPGVDREASPEEQAAQQARIDRYQTWSALSVALGSLSAEVVTLDPLLKKLPIADDVIAYWRTSGPQVLEHFGVEATA